LLLEQGDDARDGGGLAGSRAAGHDREAAQHRGGGRLLLARVGGLAGEEAVEAVGEEVEVE
jgi:hypothetical protein